MHINNLDNLTELQRNAILDTIQHKYATDDQRDSTVTVIPGGIHLVLDRLGIGYGATIVDDFDDLRDLYEPEGLAVLGQWRAQTGTEELTDGRY